VIRNSHVRLNIRAGTSLTNAPGEHGAWIAGLTALERAQAHVTSEVNRDIFSGVAAIQRSGDIEDELEVAVADIPEVSNVHPRVVRKRGRLPSTMVSALWYNRLVQISPQSNAVS
jgi:hypothetical protein